MRSVSCSHLRDNLWRYVDRELPAPVLTRLSSHLKACRECNQLYELQARDAKLFSMAFEGSPFGEGFVGRFQKRQRLEHVPPPEPKEVARHSGPGVARLRRALGGVSRAAALLAIGSLVLYGLWPRESLGTFWSVGKVVMERDGKALSLLDSKVLPGDLFYLIGKDAQLAITLSDGSSLEFQGTTEFQVNKSSTNSGPFLGSLDEGTLYARVKPRKRGAEMRLFTPHARVLVVGTRFKLRVEQNVGTTLTVDEGEVRFKVGLEHDSVRVRPETGPLQALQGEGWPRALPWPPGPPSPAAEDGKPRTPAPARPPEPEPPAVSEEPRSGGDRRPFPQIDLPVGR